MTGSNRRSGNASRGTAAKIAVAVLRWSAVAVLSLFYYAVVSSCLLFGGLLAWNGLGPGAERNAAAAHPIGGVVLILIGIVVFVFLPRLIKKLTGREVFSSPYI